MEIFSWIKLLKNLVHESFFPSPQTWHQVSTHGFVTCCHLYIESVELAMETVGDMTWKWQRSALGLASDDDEWEWDNI